MLGAHTTSLDFPGLLTFPGVQKILELDKPIYWKGRWLFREPNLVGNFHIEIVSIKVTWCTGRRWRRRSRGVSLGCQGKSRTTGHLEPSSWNILSRLNIKGTENCQKPTLYPSPLGCWPQAHCEGGSIGLSGTWLRSSTGDPRVLKASKASI